MAIGRVGTIKQFKGPFPANTLLLIPTGQNCKISISIGEDDLMRLKDFYFNINGHIIKMGKTGIYETDYTINNTEISFPNGAPVSVTVDLVYCKAEK